MIGKLNHIAIAVPDIKKAADQYKNIFGAKVSEPVEQPDHGVTTVFINLGNTKIELLEILGEDSPIQKFLDKNPKGGMHHICLEVENINDAPTLDSISTPDSVNEDLDNIIIQIQPVDIDGDELSVEAVSSNINLIQSLSNDDIITAVNKII